MMGTCAYFAVHGIEIQEYGWQCIGPTLATVLSFVFCGPDPGDPAPCRRSGGARDRVACSPCTR
ncbi:hypothetical protein QJS66_19240 [Kocuria rhizophila]|nr:hypothetical protein QJS66_19240 [Kocuria rhizophila]